MACVLALGLSLDSRLDTLGDLVIVWPSLVYALKTIQCRVCSVTGSIEVSENLHSH